MVEITLVLVALAAVGLFGVATPGLVATIGLGALFLGLALGVPTGFWYHVILYRCVSAKIPLPRRWWLSPAALHRHLAVAEARRISRWNRIGGAGFVLCLVGGVAAIAGLLLGR
jgi:hypothetical protein